MRGRRSDERRPMRNRWSKICEEWKIIKDVRSEG